MVSLDNLKVYTEFLKYPLFPVCAKNKMPFAGSHGFKDATTDCQQIQNWYKQYPNCAWGMPTTAERAVKDVDPRNGGNESFNKLISEHGQLPTTPKVYTGGGGWHYWLKFPAGTKCGKIADGIDLKAEGGYVIVPPSRIDIPEHQGRGYCWEVRPWEVPIAEAPSWLVALATKPKLTASAEAVDPWVGQAANDDLLTHQGCDKSKGEQRTPMLVKLIGVHLSRGDSAASINALAAAWAERCNPPLSESEWRPHVEKLFAKEKNKLIVLGNAGADVNELTNTAEAEGSKLVSSQAAEAEKHQTEKTVSFPELPPEAYHGLFGEMLRAIEPETEAHPAGVLLGFLCCFGNIIGRGACFTVGPRRHHPVLFVGVVGRTSDAKGDSWAAALYPYRQLEPAWAASCIANGVGSGEGLIERVADEQIHLNNKGEAEAIPGATDKRCLLRLSELSRCFKLGRRENATLSEYLREAWDGEPIHIPNRQKNGSALAASDYAISLIGDITPGVIRKLLEYGTEAFDGHANRILWAAVNSPRFLPTGGTMDVLTPYLGRLQSALTFAKSAGELKRDAEAEKLWAEVYPSLKTSGDSVPHTDRARPYVVRLAMLYALADRSCVIRAEHLRAALGVWSYCRASAQLIFQGAQAEPDPLWIQLLNTINRQPGINRKALHEAFGNRLKAEALGDALTHLQVNKLAYKQMVQPEGGGRPAECWHPGQPPDGGGGVKDTISVFNDDHGADTAACELTNKLPLTSSADACEQTNKRTNSSADSEGELVSLFADGGTQKADADPELVRSFADGGPNEKGQIKVLPPPQADPPIIHKDNNGVIYPAQPLEARGSL